MAESFPTSFTIAELDAHLKPVASRTLKLQGRALPYQPITFSGTQRMETTWYPGNPEATIQVFGSAEDETTVRGMWKDRFLKGVTADGQAVDKPDAVALFGGVAVVDVADLARKVDEMRRRGQPVLVTWDEIARHGVISKFAQTWTRRQDMEWELSFAWFSQGEASLPPVLNREVNLADTFAMWLNEIQKVREAIQPPVDLESVVAFADFINSATTELTLAMDDVVSAASSIATETQAPLDAVKRMVGIMDHVESTGQALMDVLLAEPDEAAISGFPVGTAPVGLLLGTAKYKRGVRKESRDARYQAARQKADLSKRIDPDLVATFVARQDIDLRDVSTRYYGTPNEWGRIKRFNKLSSSGLTSGQLVFVPKLQRQAI